MAARTSRDRLPPLAPYESARSPTVTAFTGRSARRNSSAGNGRSTFGDSTPTRLPRALHRLRQLDLVVDKVGVVHVRAEGGRVLGVERRWKIRPLAEKTAHCLRIVEHLD